MRKMGTKMTLIPIEEPLRTSTPVRYASMVELAFIIGIMVLQFADHGASDTFAIFLIFAFLCF